MFGDFDELDEQLDQAAAQALGETVATKTGTGFSRANEVPQQIDASAVASEDDFRRIDRGQLR